MRLRGTTPNPPGKLYRREAASTDTVVRPHVYMTESSISALRFSRLFMSTLFSFQKLQKNTQYMYSVSRQI